MAKKYEELTFTDDFMFCKILERDPDLCKELLELILDRKLGKLAPINREKPVEITPDGGACVSMFMRKMRTMMSMTSRCRTRMWIRCQNAAAIPRG